MDFASRMLPPSSPTAPTARKAMILRLSGSMMEFATVAMRPESWTLKIGKFIKLEFLISIYNHYSILGLSLGKKAPTKETSIKKKTGTCPDFLF